MAKTILITGATSGIGLEAAKLLAERQHHVLLHGRNRTKAEAAKAEVEAYAEKHVDSFEVKAFAADLSLMTGVEDLAAAVLKNGAAIDVLINNAGVLKSDHQKTPEGLDVRFAVNTFAPVLLTHRIAKALAEDARVINLSSAAQATVDDAALTGRSLLENQFDAYAQSKLALTMWSAHMGAHSKAGAPVYIALNPGSLLGTQMVKEGFGMSGKDVSIGSEILARAALSDDFAGTSGQYFDNDAGAFAAPHADALDSRLCESLQTAIASKLADMGHSLAARRDP